MNFLHISSLLFITLVVLSGAAAHGSHRRDLQQSTALALSSKDNRDRSDGRVFDFRSYGGAAAFLSSMAPNKLRRLIYNSGWHEGQGLLAQQLDQDADFVRNLQGLPCFSCSCICVQDAEAAAGVAAHACTSNSVQTNGCIHGTACALSTLAVLFIYRTVLYAMQCHMHSPPASRASNSMPADLVYVSTAARLPATALEPDL
jgi:pimeloyl-ACP methyl ester carboxylesterase